MDIILDRIDSAADPSVIVPNQRTTRQLKQT